MLYAAIFFNMPYNKGYACMCKDQTRDHSSSERCALASYGIVNVPVRASHLDRSLRKQMSYTSFMSSSAVEAVGASQQYA